MKKALIFILIAMMIMMALPVYAEQGEPEATPADTQTYYVTLVALADPNFEMVCNSITVEIQEVTQCVDFYYVTLESYNGWTNITNELPAGRYKITGVDMPRQLYSEYDYQHGVYFDVGDKINMTVSFTIGDPNAELVATPVPGAIVTGQNTTEPTQDPNAQSTPVVPNLTPIPVQGTDDPNATPIPAVTSIPSGDVPTNPPTKTLTISPYVLIGLLVVGIGVFAFVIYKNVRRKK